MDSMTKVLLHAFQSDGPYAIRRILNIIRLDDTNDKQPQKDIPQIKS